MLTCIMTLDRSTRWGQSFRKQTENKMGTCDGTRNSTNSTLCFPFFRQSAVRLEVSKNSLTSAAQPWPWPWFITSQPRTARSDGAALQCFRTWSRQRRQRLEPNQVQRIFMHHLHCLQHLHRLPWSPLKDVESEPGLATVAVARPDRFSAAGTHPHFSSFFLKSRIIFGWKFASLHIRSGHVSCHPWVHSYPVFKIQVGSSPGQPRGV